MTFVPYESTLSGDADTIPADPTRLELIVSNNSDTVMTLRPQIGAATAALGIAIPAGTAIIRTGPAACCAYSLFCAGTSKAYSAYSW